MQDFRDFVRAFALLCGKLCGNLPFLQEFLKSLAMGNFLRFWRNLSFSLFSSDFLSFPRSFGNFSCVQVVLGFWEGALAVSLFSGGF